jgi:hypothetical protein
MALPDETAPFAGFGGEMWRSPLAAIREEQAVISAAPSEEPQVQKAEVVLS